MISSATEGERGRPDSDRAAEVVAELLAKERFRLPEETTRELERAALKEAEPFGMRALPSLPD